MSIDLRGGGLWRFEQELRCLLREAYNFICNQVLPDVAQGLKEELRQESLAAGNRKLKSREYIVIITTGELVKVPSLYIGKPINGWKNSRHLIDNYWKLIKGNSPLLYDQIGYCSALGPSYEVSHQTLKKFGINVCLSSVRDINNNLANHCAELGEENLIVKQGETVKGKRVVLSIDGGRTRLREYTAKRNEKGELTYSTAWREPKLFVIDILDATVADQMILYPTDLKLLDTARGETERLIDLLYVASGAKKKPRTYRVNARKEYLKLAMKKRKSKRVYV